MDEWCSLLQGKIVLQNWGNLKHCFELHLVPWWNIERSFLLLCIWMLPSDESCVPSVFAFGSSYFLQGHHMLFGFPFFWFVGFFFSISIFNSCSKHFSYYSFLHHYYLLYFHHCTPKLCNRNNTLNSIGCWLPSRKLMSSVWALLSMYAYFSGHGHCISPFLQTFSLLRQPGGIKSEPVVWRALSPSSADWRGSSASSFTCLAMQLSIAQLSVMNE